ncbi:hypothetical protein R2R70_17395, partial [Cobetia sp. SIMBA_158]|uniref:hypothetical protein n=1 Tax=Cobetia sp. SIMBA_158 TaxID=3081617 RepID=UPI0039813CED
HLQTSFTAGNAMRPRQRMRTLRTNRREGKGFLAAMSKTVQSGPCVSLAPSGRHLEEHHMKSPLYSHLIYRRFQYHSIKRTSPSQQASSKASLQDM